MKICKSIKKHRRGKVKNSVMTKNINMIKNMETQKPHTPTLVISLFKHDS